MTKRDLAVKIVPYNNRAPKIFGDIKQFLCDTILYHINVEHIGSTAVPGLGGKGIIDILIVTKREYMCKIVELLKSKGYKSDPNTGNPPERLFVSGPYKYGIRKLHIHIHITFYGSQEHRDKLLFRDYLRQHPKEAKKYYELKKQWAAEAGSDASKYTKLKTSYINRVLEKTRKETK
jgi:GrpB-like predicted nucleotidyltransferase (UPF0157 family)